MPESKKALTAGDVARLHGLSLCDVKTIKRWWAGENVRNSTKERLEAAAKTLRLKYADD